MRLRVNRKSSLNPAASLKATAETYIAQNGLADPTNQRFIRLNDELAKAVGMKGAAASEKMTREEVVKRLRAGVSWSVSIGGQIK